MYTLSTILDRLNTQDSYNHLTQNKTTIFMTINRTNKHKNLQVIILDPESIRKFHQFLLYMKKNTVHLHIYLSIPKPTHLSFYCPFHHPTPSLKLSNNSFPFFLTSLPHAKCTLRPVNTIPQFPHIMTVLMFQCNYCDS